MLLTGTYARSMDEKQRIALPKRIREMLEGAASNLFLTPSLDRSLALYTEDTLQALANRLASASPTQQEVRAYNRMFYAQAERLELDDQGRFRVPTHLVQLASLEKEVVLVGVSDHLELWNKPQWEAYMAARASDFDRLAEQAFAAQEKTD